MRKDLSDRAYETLEGLVIALILICVILLAGGCSVLDQCEPGDSVACNCNSSMSYINYCTMDGEFLECNCYDNGGEGYQTVVDTDGGTMTGGDQDALNELYLEPPEGICNDDEVAIPGSTICWRICPAGMNMIDGVCTGYPYYQTYEFVLEECQKYNPQYRLVKMEEIVHVLEECYPSTFSTATTNYCSPYLTAPIRYTMQLPNVSTFSTWVDEMVECSDAYGQIGNNCAWDAKFYLTTQLNTEFNLFIASAQYGSAMSSGICVRD